MRPERVDKDRPRGVRLGSEGADLDQVVGQNAVSGPDPGAFGAVDAGAVPAVAGFEVTDPSFAASAPFDDAAERFPVFFSRRACAGLPLRGITTFLTPRSMSCCSTLASP